MLHLEIATSTIPFSLSMTTFHDHLVRDYLKNKIFVKTLHKDLSRNLAILNLFLKGLQGIFEDSLKKVKDLQ